MLHDSSHRLFSPHFLVRNIITVMRMNAIFCGLIGLWVIVDGLMRKNDLHSLIVGFGCVLMIPLVEHKISSLARSHRPGMYNAVMVCGLFVPVIFTVIGILELVS